MNGAYTMNLTEKIIAAHLLHGNMQAGEEITMAIDQTLTQDSTGTMTYLQLEAMGIDHVKTKKSVAYIDHNTLQAGFENADDHKYIQTVAAKHGVYFSRPGNGICHQVHLERFGQPGMTLLGSDSHTPTGGGLGMLAIGAGGLSVATAMATGAYTFAMPKVTLVELTGTLAPGASAKDVILELLRRLSVKGGVGRVMEYGGDGVAALTVPQRATIANMGAELGATSSVFPSDEQTRLFLKAQGREDGFVPLAADPDALYDETVTINLSTLEPLAACPHSPDNVATIQSLAGTKVDQVCIGSCTNSSFADMMTVAAILKDKFVAPSVSLVIAPGSRQVLTMLAQNGALAHMINAGARILECACGPCIGMGQAPATGAVSLRTFNRNFPGRSGTQDAQVYIVSPETAAASALTGVITVPQPVASIPSMPEHFVADDAMVIAPPQDRTSVEVIKGPNIKPFPLNAPLADRLQATAVIKLGDNITTDHIMPSGAKLLPYRSNIPFLADYCLTPCDPQFPAKAKAAGKGIIVAGLNYGQGSSREHAALAPVHLGIQAVIAKSFARIHRDNLMNNGILPLTFVNEADYDQICEGDVLCIENIHQALQCADTCVTFTLTITNKSVAVPLQAQLSERNRQTLLAGGQLQLLASQAKEANGND